MQPTMKEHLAIFTSGLGEKILDGQKVVEARFSERKMVPFGVVSSGDLVYVKPAGKEVIGQFKVKKVISFDSLDFADLEKIKNEYEEKIGADNNFWKAHQGAKYGTLIFIGNTTRFLIAPIKVPKKDSRGWVVLRDR